MPSPGAPGRLNDVVELAPPPQTKASRESTRNFVTAPWRREQAPAEEWALIIALHDTDRWFEKTLPVLGIPTLIIDDPDGSWFVDPGTLAKKLLSYTPEPTLIMFGIIGRYGSKVIKTLRHGKHWFTHGAC